jgi:solute carrier family 50 protein (sugar transporter)
MNFLKYSPKQSPTLPGSTRMHIQACLTAIFTTLSITAILPKIKATKVIGNLGVALCIALFASPLVALKTVIQEKSAESIPMSFTLASIVCCFFWSVVGLRQMGDFAIYFPNLLGLSFGLIQLGLKMKYGNGNSSAAQIAI